MQAQGGVQQSLLHQQSKRCPPTERTERTESSCREEPPTDGTDQHRSFVGGYGILPYPRTHILEIASHRCKLRGGAAVSAAPTKQTVSSHRTHGTHRSLVGGYGILPYPRTHIHEIASHRCKLRGCSSLCCTNKANGVLPQNARNAQNLLAEKSLPQMAQINTEVL